MFWIKWVVAGEAGLLVEQPVMQAAAALRAHQPKAAPAAQERTGGEPPVAATEHMRAVQYWSEIH
ncbi:MAG TPA: hypothetical protein VHE37_13620 [Nevskiaceae bacterium]|nr:hypothetical protein [Nevskiaceae bacterium]